MVEKIIVPHGKEDAGEREERKRKDGNILAFLKYTF